MDLRRGGSVAIVDAKGVAADVNRDPNVDKRSRRTKSDTGNETDAQPIRLARWAKIPAMSQVAVRATTQGSGLVFLDPKPSLQHRHGVRLTNGVADVMPNRVFDVIVANFSQRDRRLPKNIIIGTRIVTRWRSSRPNVECRRRWDVFSISRPSRRRRRKGRKLSASSLRARNNADPQGRPTLRAR